MDREGKEGKRNHESDHVGPVYDDSGKECPTLITASRESQADEHENPQQRHAGDRQRIQLTQSAAVKGKEIDDANADQDVQPDWKQPGAKRSQPSGYKEETSSASNLNPKIKAPLFFGLLVFLIASACTNIQYLHSGSVRAAHYKTAGVRRQSSRAAMRIQHFQS
jgi:hypothetical protein